MDQITKCCTACKQTKPRSEFWKRSKEKDGYAYRCKDCQRRMNAEVFKRKYHGDPEWRQKHIEKGREKRKRDPLYTRKLMLKMYYGMTLEEYAFKLAEQGGVCAVCGKHPTKRRSLAVDHDHDTGEVRGLLCTQCNQALGLLQDNPETVDSLLTYIKSFKAAQAGT